MATTTQTPKARPGRFRTGKSSAGKSPTGKFFTAESSRAKPDARWTAPADPVPVTAHTRISANGRIVIPAAMREKLGIRADERVVLKLEDNAIRLITHEENIRQIQAYFKQFAKPGVLWSEELIAERREEARREEAELDEYLISKSAGVL